MRPALGALPNPVIHISPLAPSGSDIRPVAGTDVDETTFYPVLMLARREKPWPSPQRA